MKKVFVLLLIVAFYMGIGVVTEKTNIIPKEAIRIRVIGNSNQEEDQELKMKVKENLENYYYQLLKDTKGVDQASILIQDSLEDVKSIVGIYSPEFQINYGKNYFPQKVYKGITYEEGYYDSLVVTLGKGKGKNWWCVLFPPICLLENQSDMDEIEYHSLVKDLIDQYF